MQRQSLLDGDDFSSIGGKRGGGGGGGSNMDSKKVIKLSIAIVLFLAAGGLFAWQMDLFGSGKSEFAPEPVSAEKQRAREEATKKAEEEMERLEREGKATIGGA